MMKLIIKQDNSSTTVHGSVKALDMLKKIMSHYAKTGLRIVLPNGKGAREMIAVPNIGKVLIEQSNDSNPIFTVTLGQGYRPEEEKPEVEIVTKTYAELTTLRQFNKDNEVIPVTSRDLNKIEIPENVTSITFFDKLETTSAGVRLQSYKLNESLEIFILGNLCTADEFEKLDTWPGKKTEILRTMRSITNGIEFIIVFPDNSHRYLSRGKYELKLKQQKQ